MIIYLTLFRTGLVVEKSLSIIAGVVSSSLQHTIRLSSSSFTIFYYIAEISDVSLYRTCRSRSYYCRDIRGTPVESSIKLCNRHTRSLLSVGNKFTLCAIARTQPVFSIVPAKNALKCNRGFVIEGKFRLPRSFLLYRNSFCFPPIRIDDDARVTTSLNMCTASNPIQGDL